jgi:hypothetical protein
MLFEGQRGTPAHFLASTTNGTSGNATFGMTSGTNGCSTNASLTYGGKSWFAMNGMMNELSEDMAKGNGEALTTYAVVLGVAPEDRAHFAAVTHEHFQQIFSKADVTAEDVHTNTLAVLKATHVWPSTPLRLKLDPTRFFGKRVLFFFDLLPRSLFFFEFEVATYAQTPCLAGALCLRPAVRRASHRPSTFAATGQRPFWISLGHYETAKLGGWRSYVSDKKFFLAADGNEHPDHELAATVQALYAPASLGEQHAQCVYPARTRWLKAQLNLTDLPTRTAPNSSSGSRMSRPTAR